MHVTNNRQRYRAGVSRREALGGLLRTVLGRLRVSTGGCPHYADRDRHNAGNGAPPRRSRNGDQSLFSSGVLKQADAERCLIRSSLPDRAWSLPHHFESSDRSKVPTLAGHRPTVGDATRPSSRVWNFSAGGRGQASQPTHEHPRSKTCPNMTAAGKST
jgi:hypothetical protein